MKNIALYDVDMVDELVWPDKYQGITLESPAVAVLTDFRKAKPFVVDEASSAAEAEKLMLEEHVRLKIVVNKSYDFLGVISLEDINSQEVMKRIADGAKRSELLVANFMRPKSSLKAIRFSELKRASVGDVVELLRSNGLQHCLVVDGEKHQIRGVISASDLARGLRIPMNLSISPSFLDIFKAVHHQEELYRYSA
jgi:DeoR family transcriptional regulator, catabolite repression regulator